MEFYQSFLRTVPDCLIVESTQTLSFAPREYLSLYQFFGNYSVLAFVFVPALDSEVVAEIEAGSAPDLISNTRSSLLLAVLQTIPLKLQQLL